MIKGAEKATHPTGFFMGQISRQSVATLSHGTNLMQVRKLRVLRAVRIMKCSLAPGNMRLSLLLGVEGMTTCIFILLFFFNNNTFPANKRVTSSGQTNSKRELPTILSLDLEKYFSFFSSEKEINFLWTGCEGSTIVIFSIMRRDQTFPIDK